MDSEGVRTVSSEDLAVGAGVKPTQLRKDLAYFGQFGTRGLGYDVKQLSEILGGVLGNEAFRPVILVGAGNLGMALLSYRGFLKEGFDIVAAFDTEPDRRRDKEIEQPLLPMDRLGGFLKENPVRMSILCVPAVSAQETADILVGHGITGILNFSPVLIRSPDSVVVRNVNLAIELENLSYFVKNGNGPEGRTPGAGSE